MTALHSSTIGAVPSADIAVPEHERELQFYARILTTGQSPLWREDLMSNAGIPVIGLGERNAEHADLPVQWMPHIQVADVAASARRALALGGRELMHGKDDGGRSQWAVLVDPNGAAFGIIPVVGSEAPTPIRNEASSETVGRIAGLDLTVSEASVTRDFYRDVVGWSVQDVEMEDAGERYADYALCTPDGTAVAGICHARAVNRAIPPVWLIRLPVGDLGESLRLVQKGGGEVVRARKGTGGEYVHAVIRDPVGACLALVRPGLRAQGSLQSRL
ncbi:MAG: VOC family protein [Gemmatimonadetes bacterium]|nr:VOC family protein [Gemmatimonadota bacterium]